MGNRQDVQQIPGALRKTLEKAHTEYLEVARKVRWGDGPVYVCGTGHCAALGAAAGYAFETLLDWPVVARPVEVFQSYSLSLLRPRSVLLMISDGGEWPEAHELAATARERGCTLLALASAPDSPLASLADHVFTIQAGADRESPAVTVCMHAALNRLAFEVARLLKKPRPFWDVLEKDFDQLPDKIEWVHAQLSGVVRSVAAELASSPRLRIVGGGFNYYPAWRAARRMRFVPGVPVEAVEASEFWSENAHLAQQGDTLLFLSGSQSRLKKLLHRCALQAHKNGARVISLTDSNDRDLVEGSDLGILLPSLHEMPASTLALAMLEWLSMETLLAGKKSS